MTQKRLTDEELAAEARRWDGGELAPQGWIDSPDAVVRARESVSIDLRLPTQLLSLLEEFARREGIGLQVLVNRWLDDRLAHERERRRQEATIE
jgi:hypothetical protein